MYKHDLTNVVDACEISKDAVEEVLVALSGYSIKNKSEAIQAVCLLAEDKKAVAFIMLCTSFLRMMPRKALFDSLVGFEGKSLPNNGSFVHTKSVLHECCGISDERNDLLLDLMRCYVAEKKSLSSSQVIELVDKLSKDKVEAAYLGTVLFESRVSTREETCNQ